MILFEDTNTAVIYNAAHKPDVILTYAFKGKAVFGIDADIVELPRSCRQAGDFKGEK